MLLALSTAFALSQAFRTVAAMMARPLQTDFGLTPQQLGVFAGSFHFAFGAMQVLVGVGIDLHGIRKTVLAAFPLAIVGSALSAWAPSYPALVFGQVLIGFGCAPAFLVCTVFIARRFPGERFASISGTVLALGGVGMLMTGTPLAWLIERSSWRAGFAALAIASVAAWLTIFGFVHDAPDASDSDRSARFERESIGSALRGFAQLLTLRHTWGIVALGAVTYAAFLAFRGLWLGPFLIERYGYTLVASGNVALLLSIVSLIGPPLFGRFDPGRRTRRRWLVAYTLLHAALFGALALHLPVAAVLAASIVIGVVSGYMVLQYADVREAYPPELTGRAMALFTMSMFLGVALMQWLTGLVASIAAAHGADPYRAVFIAIAALLGAGAFAFATLPAPLRAR